jgi:hypothetical protein
MRLWPLTKQARQAVAAAGDVPSVSSDTPVISVASSSRSYDSPLGIVGTNTLKQDVDLAVYDSLIRAFPFLDVGLRKLARMIVPFTVKCDNEATETALNEWIGNCVVEDVFRGITPFTRPYVRQALQYGRSAGEIVLSETKRDIAGLTVIDAKKVRLIRTEEGLQVGERNALGQEIIYPDQSLILYSALNKEGDDPLGVSLLRSIPFVSDICLRMENAVRQMWQRHGAPSFLILHTVDSDIPVSDEQLSARRSAIESAWHDSQKARRNNEGIIDFTVALQGGLTFQSIGADVKELEFPNTYRALTEQIVSSVELAPFMLGLQWSTTERLSQQQADAIIGAIDDFRAELKPDFERVIDWVQRVNGWRGNAYIEWEEVNLQDRRETAEAERVKAVADTTRLQYALTAWANGFIDQDGAAELAGFEDPVVTAMDAPVMPGAAGGNANAGADAAAQALWGAYPMGGRD